MSQRQHAGQQTRPDQQARARQQARAGREARAGRQTAPARPAEPGTGRMRRALTVLGGAVVVVAAVAFFWPHGSGASDAYGDPRIDGSITLYGPAGQVVTSGSVDDRPFVAKAVQSDAAPAPYDQPGSKATLLAYQPRQGAPSTDWSGDTLTGASAYTDPAHPAVVSASTDFSLRDYLDEFPARWDGRVQLRIYLSGPGQPVRNTAYAATTLVVSGDTWHVADPAGAAGPLVSGDRAPSGFPAARRARWDAEAPGRRTGVVGA